MRKLITAISALAMVFLIVQSCSKSGDNNTGPTGGSGSGASFDRKGLLSNAETNIILPAYNSFQTDVNALDAAIAAFNTSPNVTTLTTAQTAFKTAYLQWQSTSTFEFGPAADQSLSVSVNTFPTDVNQITSNINANTYDPNLLANLSARGLPAIDYLLFGIGADNNTVVTLYSTDSKAANRRTYLAAISAEIKTKTTATLNGWNNGYSATFLNATGTDVGSSLGQMVNQLVYDYEILKNYEIGVPSGVQSMGTTFPQKVQAYYSKMSVQLVLAHLQAIQNLYEGKSAQGDGLGLDDYLVSANAKYNGGSLNDAIKAQFATATTKLQALSDPLSTQITNNPAAVTAAYTELQKLTVLLKTDMTSSLGILITFGDTDGD